VIVIDHIDYRLEFVRNFAPAEVYNFKELDDVVLFMKKTTDGLGADVCIDAVGAEATGNMLQTILGKRLKMEAGSAIALHWAINSVKKGGIVSIVGVYGPTGNMVPIGNVVNKGLTLRGNQASVKRLMPRLIEHVRAGHINPKAIITHKVPLDDIADAYHMFSAKLDDCIKPVLVPSGA
jgi:threonine dehydrogenase-like Zn-dependent dehydrogenase